MVDAIISVCLPSWFSRRKDEDLWKPARFWPKFEQYSSKQLLEMKFATCRKSLLKKFSEGGVLLKNVQWGTVGGVG
jgi:hypothetical protein